MSEESKPDERASQAGAPAGPQTKAEKDAAKRDDLREELMGVRRRAGCDARQERADRQGEPEPLQLITFKGRKP